MNWPRLSHVERVVTSDLQVSVLHQVQYPVPDLRVIWKRSMVKPNNKPQSVVGPIQGPRFVSARLGSESLTFGFDGCFYILSIFTIYDKREMMSM